MSDHGSLRTQVLPFPDLGGHKVTPKLGVPCQFCFSKFFAKMHDWDSRTPLDFLLGPGALGVEEWGNPPKNVPPQGLPQCQILLRYVSQLGYL